MMPSTRSRYLALLLAPALLVAACAQPTVEEIRDQAKADFYGLLRHTADVLDQVPNRTPVNDFATRLAQLGGESGAIDLFGGYAFKPNVETFIADLDTGIPDIFSEANVVDDISDGKRFRVTLQQFCWTIAGKTNPDCKADLAQVSVDFDVTLDGSTVRIAMALTGKSAFATATIQSGRIVLDLDGAKTIAALDEIATKTGGKPIDVQKLAGSWHVDWRKDGTRVVVEASLKDAELEQPMKITDSAAGTTRESTVKLAVTQASGKATLGDGKASVDGAFEPKTLVIPATTKDLVVESGALSGSASADGSGKVQLTLKASGEPSLAIKVDGKTFIAVTMNRGGAGEWALTLEPHGARTAITLGAATKPRFELHAEVYDPASQAMADPVLDAELSAQLSVVPRTEAGVMLEVVAGSAKLSHGTQSMEISAGSCLLEKDATDPQSPLDVMAAGACPL